MFVALLEAARPALMLTSRLRPPRRLYLSSDQFVYNPYYLVTNSPMQTTLGDARLRDAALSFYRKNGRVSAWPFRSAQWSFMPFSEALGTCDQLLNY